VSSSTEGSRTKKAGLVEEFKAFALRGSAIDLAVGVVIGAAFGAVVSSLVEDVLTPLLGIFGTPDFKDELVFRIGEGEFRMGVFLNALISLVMISAAVFFFVIKPVNKLSERRKPQPPVEVTVRECPYCLSSIPAKASRCSFCTSEVPPGSQPAEPDAVPEPA
jgi:large conductance mechanosensitive channel